MIVPAATAYSCFVVVGLKLERRDPSNISVAISGTDNRSFGRIKRGGHVLSCSVALLINIPEKAFNRASLAVFEGMVQMPSKQS